MRSNAQIREHPIHPMLVAFPIGLWVTSIVWDIAYLSTRDTFWYNVSYWTIMAGVVGALLAAIPGFIDYFTLDLGERARNVATTHMVLNLSAVVLFLVNLWIRADSAAAGASFGWVFALSVIIVLGVAVSGWLGGHMVYVEHLAVIDTPEELAQDMIVRRSLLGQPGMAGALGGEAPAQPADKDEDDRTGSLGL